MSCSVRCVCSLDSAVSCMCTGHWCCTKEAMVSLRIGVLDPLKALIEALKALIEALIEALKAESIVALLPLLLGRM